MRRPGSLVSVRAMTQKVISPGLKVATPAHAGCSFAARRQDRGYGDEVLLLDIGVAQREFERRQQVAMDADASGQEHAGRHREHGTTS